MQSHHSTTVPDDMTPKGFSKWITNEPVSNVELGALSVLLALLVLLLARIVHLLVSDYILPGRCHRHADSPSDPRLVSIKDESCSHDVSAQAPLTKILHRNNKPTAQFDFTTFASSTTSTAMDLVEDTVRNGVEMAKELGQNAANFGDAWSGDLLTVPDEDEAYHSYESDDTLTETNNR